MFVFQASIRANGLASKIRKSGQLITPENVFAIIAMELGAKP
jgi:hypothetical protein